MHSYHLPAKKGFLILEALLAMGILLMIIPAALSLDFSGQAMRLSIEKKLGGLSGSADSISNGAYEQAAAFAGRYSHEFGKSTCTIGLDGPNFSAEKTKIYVNDPDGAGPNGSGGIYFSADSSTTDITARNGYMYMTTDSAIQSIPDLYVINSLDPEKPILVSSLDTGPGLAGVTVAGHYAYVANKSSVSELQVIDLQDRGKPVIAARLKLPLPTATTTAPHASGIFYEDGMIFLGTEKWAGNEFNGIDVSYPALPQYAEGFDAGTLVDSIYVNAYDPKYAYVADADAYQMRVLDISDPSHIGMLSGFSPAGSGVLEGTHIAVSGPANADSFLYFTRAGGGFDNPAQYELFAFDISRDPLASNPIHTLNIPGGIYGIVADPCCIFLAAGDGSLQIWKSDLSELIYRANLPSKPVSLSCDHDRLYVGLAGRQGFVIIIPH